MRKPLLLLPWAIAALLLIQTATASIEYEDDDITFDDVPTRPEGPGRPPETEGWSSYFHSALSRVKRGWFDFLDSDKNSSTTVSETTPTTPTTPTTTVSTAILTSSPLATSPELTSHSRDTRSTSSDLESTPSRNGALKNSDDEDEVTASGSGLPWDHSVSTGHQESEPYNIFRIKMYIQEFWVRDYANKHSAVFDRFAKNFTRELEQFFDAPVGGEEPLPGSRTATVIGIDQSKDDNMLILVTADLGSKGYAGDGIKNRLRRHVTDSNRLGTFTVKIDSAHPLTVQQFTERNPSGHSECEANQVVCRDGVTCLDIETRCNGRPDCPDGEDEEECPSTDESTSGITAAPESRRFSDVGAAPLSPEEGEEDSSPSSVPRCDDEKFCPNGYQKICDTQVCDGIQDCEGETEEVNCDDSVSPSTTTTTTTEATYADCLTSEFMCDVSRCIPINKKCDGVPDCNDKTDEETDCPLRREYYVISFCIFQKSTTDSRLNVSSEESIISTR